MPVLSFRFPFPKFNFDDANVWLLTVPKLNFGKRAGSLRIRDALPRGVSPRRSVHGGAARAAGVFVRVEDEGAVGGIERIAGALAAEDSHRSRIDLRCCP